MGIILRRDKGSKLSIEELDNNIEYLAMDSNDIDLFWRNDQIDSASDTMYINGLLRTFTSEVSKLGLRIRNYDLIKDYNPEFVIERYKKTDRKRRGGMSYFAPAQFRITEPYSESVISSEMTQIDPSKVSIFRPMIFPIAGTSSYTRIYAENYFSQIKPPRVSGSKGNNFYKYSTGSIEIFDDTDTYSIDLPRKQVGIVYCRLRIRISDGLGGYKYSKPLKEFKIRMILKSSDTNSTNAIIKYDMT